MISHYHGGGGLSGCTQTTLGRQRNFVVYQYLTLWTDPDIRRLLDAKATHVIEAWTELTAAVRGAAFSVANPTECVRFNTLHQQGKLYTSDNN